MTSRPPTSPTPADVRTALADLQIADLRVDEVDGCLYLRGAAQCYKSKQLAEERARSIAPSACLVNELRVAQAAADDDAIARDVKEAIARVAPLAGSVQIDVREGVVTLQGTVRDEEERSAVECATWDAHGVTQVRSHLDVVSGEVGDPAVSEALNEYVQRAMHIAPGQIVVQYRSGIVSLSGSVSTAAQGEAIEDLLRWHDRVIDVVSHLRVGAAEPLAGRAS